MFVRQGQMELEDLLSQAKEQMEYVDQYIFQDAAIDHADELITILETIKNTIEQNL